MLVSSVFQKSCSRDVPHGVRATDRAVLYKMSFKGLTIYGHDIHLGCWFLIILTHLALFQRLLCDLNHSTILFWKINYMFLPDTCHGGHLGYCFPTAFANLTKIN